jgi:hypothetical protein
MKVLYSVMTLYPRIPPFVGTDMSLLPKPTWPGSVNGSDDWVLNFAEGTRLDCYRYANGTQLGNITSCNDVANGFGVSVDNLKQWNPSLNQTCSLTSGLAYCVLLVENNTPNITEACIDTQTPAFNTTCDDFIALNDVTLDLLSSWNPAIGQNCENFKQGMSTSMLLAIISSNSAIQQVMLTAWRYNTTSNRESFPLAINL